MLNLWLEKFTVDNSSQDNDANRITITGSLLEHVNHHYMGIWNSSDVVMAQLTLLGELYNISAGAMLGGL